MPVLPSNFCCAYVWPSCLHCSRPILVLRFIGALGWRSLSYLFLLFCPVCSASWAFLAGAISSSPCLMVAPILWASDPIFLFFCVLLHVFLTLWAGFPSSCAFLLVAHFLHAFLFSFLFFLFSFFLFSFFLFLFPFFLFFFFFFFPLFSSSGGPLGPPRGRLASCPTNCPTPLQSRLQLALSVLALLLAYAFQACAGLGGSGVPGVGLVGGSPEARFEMGGFVRGLCVGLCPCCPGFSLPLFCDSWLH